MARLTRTCQCLLSLIASAVPCAGQQETPPPPPPVKVVVVDSVRILPEQVLETAGKAKVVFNNETRRKRAYVELPLVAPEPGRGIDMSVGYRYEGRAAKPLWFNVEFTGDADSFGNVAGHRVVLESDGQEFDLGKAFAAETLAKDASRVVLRKTVIYDTFVRVFGGEDVRIRVGSFSFRLGEAELAAVRDLIKLTGTKTR